LGFIGQSEKDYCERPGEEQGKKLTISKPALITVYIQISLTEVHQIAVAEGHYSPIVMPAAFTDII
jgi:hypothetical protein